MSPDFDPWGWVKWLGAAISSILIWVFKRHVDEDEKRAAALAVVQQTYATRDDIAVLHQKIDDNHREVMRVLTRSER